MFVRASTIVFSVAALAGFVSGAPAELAARDDACNSGSVQCCNSLQQSDSTFIAELFGYMNIAPPAAGTQVGLTCSPLSIAGSGGGASCTQQTVCCNGNSFSGFVVIGCSPITINM